MNEYHIRDIIKMTDEEVWQLPEEVHCIRFDDEPVVSHTRATILTWYYLQFFREFPNATCCAKWHVEHTGFDGKVQINTLSDVYWSVYEDYEARGEELDLDRMDYLCFEIVQAMYNDLSVNIDEYMLSTSLIDLLEIANHPVIKEVNANLIPTQHGIEEVAYKKIADVLLNDRSLRHNPNQVGLRSGSFPVGQVLQCVTARGFATDIDSAIGKYPIMTGFLHGVKRLYDSLLESRSAVKAILYNQELVQDSEYFNREIQLIASYLKEIVAGDCGSTSYVRQPILKDTHKFYVGKYYLNEETKQLELITEDNVKSLIGKTIKMRSILGCSSNVPGGICEICYGRMSKQMVKEKWVDGIHVPGTVIGHVSATEVCGTITQLLFSTKHLDSTSHIDPFKLGQGESHYLNVDNDDNIFLKPLFKKRRYTISFLSEQLHSITDLNVVDDPNILKPRRVSCITNILVDLGKYDPMGYNGPVELRVYNHNRKPCLTKDALIYFKEKGWTQSQDGKIVTIDMSDWDVTKPFMVLPFIHVNMAEYKREFQSFYYSSSDQKKAFKGRNINKASDDTVVLCDFKDVSTALAAFINLNPSKLGSNIVHYESLVLVMMARKVAENDYRMPLNAKENGEFSVFTRVIANRSLGPLMAHERQERAVLNYRFYGRTKLDSSYLDSVLLGGADLNKEDV